MRILTATHFYEAHGGGIERVAGHLNRHLQSLGHDTLWAASDEDSLPELNTAKAVRLKCANPTERLTGLPMPLPYPRSLQALCRAIRMSDAVIIHDALYVTSISAMVAARLSGRPVILIQHIAEIPFASRLMRLAMKMANYVITLPMLRTAHQVIFISGITQSAFSQIKSKRPPVLLFNGVETEIFHPTDSRARSELRQALGLEGKCALFVGRFVEKKGLSIIEALARSRPDISFVLAGRGPIEPEAWQLSNVRVEKYRSGQSLAELYQAADVLVLPSVGEGYPLVIQEAMACGLPVICGADTARADPDASSWLIPVDIDLRDPSGTAMRVSTAIDKLPMADPAMSIYAAETYSWSAMAENVLHCIEALSVTTPQPASADAR